MEEDVKGEDTTLEVLPLLVPPSVTIKTDYVRTKKSDTPETYVKSPITGEMIKESDFSEHMRVVLLDPQWKKQSEMVMKRAREEASALAEDIGDNIADFIQKRLQMTASSDTMSSIPTKASNSSGIGPSLPPKRSRVD